jgi:hypothetical protein
MKIKSQKDFWSGLMFVVAGASFAVVAMNHRFGSSAAPGPGMLPFALGLLLTLLGALVLFKALTIEVEGEDPIGGIAWRPLLLVNAAVLAFGLTLPRLGLVVAAPLLVLILSVAGDGFRWREVLLDAAALTLGSALLVLLLGLELPLAPH